MSEVSRLVNRPLKDDLLNLYDDFVELQDYCSFLCDAFAYFSKEEEHLDHSTIMGISRFCGWMKANAQDLKEDLEKIHERSCTESHASEI